VGLLGRIRAAVNGSEYVGKDVQDWLDDCCDMGSRKSDYTLYTDFYDGKLGAMLRDRAREYLVRHGVEFSENFVEPVVDSAAERLEVVGFVTDGATVDEASGATVDAAAEVLDDWWQLNRMDGVAGTVHTRTLIQGDEFVIVDYDADVGRPRFYRQQPHQMSVEYSPDDPDVLDRAVKVWQSEEESNQNPAGRPITRLNVYWPDRIEKWFRLSTGTEGKGGWGKWLDDDDVWPTPWVDAAGEPLGVNVIHFRSKALGDTYGRSRVRATIPFQEQLNKYCADLNDLVDNHALPQDVVTGVAGDSTFKRVPGDVWQSPSTEAKFDRLEASPVSNLLEAIEGVLSRLARRSRVPMHLLTGGTPPSGEALKTSESGLVAVVKDMQIAFGNSWEDMMAVAVRLSDVFGTTSLGDLVISAEWANPETRSDTADLEIALKKRQLGVSDHTILNELGYDPVKEKELVVEETRAKADAQGAVFDRGGLPV